MGITTCNSKAELKKGPWTREEDQKLLAYIDQHGYGSWRTLPTKAGLQRCGKSCRLRWTNYLRPDIKRGKFDTHEEKAIIRLHALLGNRWSAIAAHLPKRTDNEIKNYWNTRLKKRLTRMGIDPATHKPRNSPPGSAQTTHMAQWEAARLEAEARLKLNLPLLRRQGYPPPPPPLAPLPCLDVLKVWQSSSSPGSFFSSTGSLESPTSTLSFNSLTLPTSGWMQNSACGTQVEVEETDDYFAYDCGFTAGPVDLPSLNEDSGTATFVAEMEDGKNYWDYLLNLVSSPFMDC